MTSLRDSLSDRLTRRDAFPLPAASQEQPIAAPAAIGPRGIAAAVVLAIAGVSCPIAVTAVGAVVPLLGSPWAATALAGLLLVIAALLGLTVALSGLDRLAAAFGAEARGETEQAVARVCLDALLLGYALGIAALTPDDGAAAICVSTAGLALVVAWTILLYLAWQPAPSAPRHIGATALDIALFSAFLHFGGGWVAGWYPLYLLLIAHAGFRFGVPVLLAVTAASILGLAGVVLSTASWRQQPALAIGLIAALAVFAAVVAAAVRAAGAARSAAAAASADRSGVLQLILETLGRSADPRVADVIDLAAVEAGTFAPPTKSFDLRALINAVLAPVRQQAADQGGTLRWRVDPYLPARLRGHADVIGRIVANLARHAVAGAGSGAVRILIDAERNAAETVTLRLRVDARAAIATPDETALELRLLHRLLGLAGGELSLDELPGDRISLCALLPLTVAADGSEAMIDLGGRPALIVTADRQLAGELAALIDEWNGDVRQLDNGDAALTELTVAAPGAMVIIDGRDRMMAALALAHQITETVTGPRFVLLVAEQAQIDGLRDIDGGELDGLLPAPLERGLVANALRGLPLTIHPASATSALPEIDRAAQATERQHTQKPERITPIAAHPRFTPEPAALDGRAVERLHVLGGGSGFVREIIDAFRTDAQHIMARVAAAAAAADPAAFGRSLVPLRRAAAQLGGTELCELLGSLQGLTAADLRQQGAVLVQRLDTEIDRLADSMSEALPVPEAHRT